MTGTKILQKCILVTIQLCVTTLVTAQESKAVWDTHENLMEWLSLSESTGIQVRGIEQLTEGSRDFIRIKWSEVNVVPGIMNPNDDELDLIGGLVNLPTLVEPGTHNAVGMTMRQTMGVDLISGMWFHRDGQYDESLGNVPKFEPQGLPSDAEWHEITMRFSDSPFLDPEDDIVVMGFGLGDSAGSENEKFLATKEEAVLDIDRIEFVSLPETIPTPVIASISPTRGPVGTQVTIHGVGFAEPVTSNVVLFGDLGAEIVSGDSSTLVVKARGIGEQTVTVLRPGGTRVVAAERFTGIGRPRMFTVVSGDEQSGPPGATLAPIVVRVGDIAAQGIRDLTVTFSVVTGDGMLSATQATTGEDGMASTILTLGNTPGTVGVEVRVDRFRPKVLTATINPQ